MQHLTRLKSAYFFYCMLLICLAYLTFEYFYIPYGALSADEFVFARHIYDYTLHVPYVDFPPYKTVLGYYLLSLPLFFFHSLLAPLFLIKGEIAIINTVLIAVSCYWARHFFNKNALLLTILAIIANQSFLLYSSDLRVDMLTSWTCLLAALSILQQRFRLSGLLLSIAFLISQKALWYFFAINGGLIICYLCFNSPLYSLRSIFSFNLTMLLPIFIYTIYWSVVASPAVVLNNLFYEAYIQAGIDWYLPIYFFCWQIVLKHGPLLFLLWPVTFISLFDNTTTADATQQRVFIMSFATIALLLFILYKQPFPYNFVFTIPAYFLLYASFISWLFSKNIQRLLIYSLVMLFLLIGVVYPLYQSVLISLALNGKYQKTMLLIINNLLDKDESYISGIPFLYQKDQPIDGLKNLIGPSIAYLYQPSDKLAPLLLPSLYLSPTSIDKILFDFESAPVKLIINNYRMLSLPEKISTYIKNNYQHFYGSIYLYAPKISARQLNFTVHFNAQYQLVAKSNARILIDGKKIHPNKLLTLTKGDHLSDANISYRLVLVPKINKKQLAPEYQADNWLYMIRAILS